MRILKTVKIKHDGPLGYAIINADDYDPSRHKLLDGDAGGGKAADDDVASDELSPWHDFTDEKLRGVYEAVIGRKPHPKMTREKLVAKLAQAQELENGADG